MVKKAKAKDSSGTTVRRIKAQDDKKPKEAAPKKPTPSKSAKLTASTNPEKAKGDNILKRFIGYFKGAWYELKQVRWPNRRATLGMTAALLIFTGLFSALILAIDLLWENLFKLILR